MAPYLREFLRVLAGLLIAFAVMALTAAYWGLVQAPGLVARSDNPRQVEAIRRQVRGGIYDSDGQPIAWTTAEPDGVAVRTTSDGPYASIAGAFSLAHGATGLESLVDAVVSPQTDTADPAAARSASRGADVRVTLDEAVQTALDDAMSGLTGSAVVVSVPDGRILGYVSNPSASAGSIAADWDALLASPDDPLVNRAFERDYAPGGELQTVLMMAALLADLPLDEAGAGATSPVDMSGIQAECAIRLPDESLSLRDSYAFACPDAFARLAGEIDAAALESLLSRVADLQASAGRISPVVVEGGDTIETTETPASLMAEALGQGSLRLSPMAMALLSAAVINDGNAPQPVLIDALRANSDAPWAAFAIPEPATPVTTANTARRLQDLMRYAVAEGAAQNAGRRGLDIAGHASVTTDADTPLAWFTGFRTLGGGQAAAVAVLLENSVDAGLAADIAGTALASVSAGE